MATVASLNTAILTVLDAIDYIDQTSANDFLPTVATAKAALLAVPQGQRDAFTMFSLTNLGSLHRLRFELWVKHTPGASAATMARAREFGQDAALLLFADDGGTYTLAPDEAIDYQVDEFLTEFNGVSWLVAVLTVPVLNEVAL